MFSALRLKNGEMTYELKPPIRKLAERIQKGLDLEIILEPPQKVAELNKSLGISDKEPTLSPIQAEMLENNFRTPIYSITTIRLGFFDPQTGSMLRR